MLTRRTLLKSAMVGAAGAALPLGLYRPASTPAAVQGFATPLPLLPKARPVANNSYLITARPGTEVMHPAFGRTRVWGYDDNSGRGVASPGYTIEAQQGHARRRSATSTRCRRSTCSTTRCPTTCTPARRCG